MQPGELSRELRKGDNANLTRRRWIMGLSLLSTLMAQIVTLYQMGMVRRLPDPPLPGFDASKVDASDYAYRRLQTPDGLLMLVSYGFTAWLAGAGGKERARQNPVLPVALGVKTLMDSALALELAREEWNENKAFCAYCQVATLCSLASVVLALPEALQSGKRLFKR